MLLQFIVGKEKILFKNLTVENLNVANATSSSILSQRKNLRRNKQKIVLISILKAFNTDFSYILFLMEHFNFNKTLL